MNDVDFPVATVLAGIEAAAAAGLRPIKLNMVVKRGGNEDSILPMARRFRGSGHILRFIEFMDVGHTNGWRLDDVVPAAEILGRVHADFPLEPMAPNYAGEVAGRCRYADGAGEIGVIASVTPAVLPRTAPGRGSRPTGTLYTCLFAGRGHDLRDLMRSGATDDGPGRQPCAACGNGARIGIPRSARRRPTACPRSRCRSSAVNPPPSGRRRGIVR